MTHTPLRHWSLVLAHCSLVALPLLLAACESSTNRPARFIPASMAPIPDVPVEQPAPAIAAETLQGTVGPITSNARNFPRNFLLNTSAGESAINVPDILSDAFALTVKPGDALTAVVGTTTTDEGKSAFLLLSFTTPAGATYSVPSTAARSYQSVEGTIAAVSRDKKGNPTSLLLSSGHIVRLDPRNTKSPEIEKDEPFTAEGEALPLSKGRFIVKAVSTNGVTLRLNLPPGGWGKTADVGDEGGEGDGGEMMGGGDFGGGE